MKSYIPNFLTLLNVLSGCVATVFAVLNHLEWAALFVFIGIFFDFFDGLAARLLGVQSEIGVQLDSLADVITSGLVPGVVMFQLLSMAERGGWNLGFIGHDAEITLLPFVGFAITLASLSIAVAAAVIWLLPPVIIVLISARLILASLLAPLGTGARQGLRPGPCLDAF